MPSRQYNKKRRLPKIWLMTDPRFGTGLPAAVRKLPAGSGVVFRHYDLPKAERQRLFQDIDRICRQRGHVLMLAGKDEWLADGVHGRARKFCTQLLSKPVHNIRELRNARRERADLVLLSPLFATRTHPGARPLGMMRFAQLSKLAKPAKVIALGGMTRNRARAIKAHVAHGWSAIDAFRV